MNFYEKHGVLLCESKPWEYDNYGFWPNGLGDCISRTMGEDRESEIPQHHIRTCGELLIQRKRWPDQLNGGRIAPNKIRELWSKLLQRLYLQKHCLYRPQGNMSRDPFIHLWATCYARKLPYYIHAVKAPLHLYRPTLWAWRKYLITGKHKKRYELFAIISLWIGMPEYARNQERIKAEVVGSKRVLNFILNLQEKND